MSKMFEQDEIDNSGLPPPGPLSVSIKREAVDEDHSESATGEYKSPGPLLGSRKDSLGWASDDLMGMITHTPPAFSPGSLEIPLVKRNRSGSISGRLRSASDLEERGVIDRYQKGVLKDLIISGDQNLQKALDKFENGDASALEALMDSGALNRKTSFDLMDDLDFGFLNVGSLGNTPKDDEYTEQTSLEGVDDWDDLRFETAFADISAKGVSIYDEDLETSLQNSLPSIGMGITPPNPFGLSENFLDKREVKSGSDEEKREVKETSSSGSSSSRPIVIPGAGSNSKDAENAPKKFVGAYSPDSRRRRIEKFLEKRSKRVWTKKVKYDVRKNFADSRLRVKGRFVKKEDEQLLRELLSFT